MTEVEKQATVDLIDELRKNEGSSVSICCVNPEISEPHEAIEVVDDWTGYKILRFTGDTLLDCLAKAVLRRDEQLAEGGE